uniref:Uncharacterized protein n=1 Tax=Rhizophora mucronata TaxID=61149 RepID=A0A2P2P540_RHIMU
MRLSIQMMMVSLMSLEMSMMMTLMRRSLAMVMHIIHPTR